MRRDSRVARSATAADRGTAFPAEARVHAWGVELAHEVLCLPEDGGRLLDARDLVGVALDLVLGLDAGVLRLRTVSGSALRASQTDVLVVPDGLLGKPADDLVLLVAEAVNPAVHVLEHLTLDLAARVVEVRVEAAQEMLHQWRNTDLG